MNCAGILSWYFFNQPDLNSEQNIDIKTGLSITRELLIKY